MSSTTPDLAPRVSPVDRVLGALRIASLFHWYRPLRASPPPSPRSAAASGPVVPAVTQVELAPGGPAGAAMSMPASLGMSMSTLSSVPSSAAARRNLGAPVRHFASILLLTAHSHRTDGARGAAVQRHVAARQADGYARLQPYANNAVRVWSEEGLPGRVLPSFEMVFARSIIVWLLSVAYMGYRRHPQVWGPRDKVLLLIAKGRVSPTKRRW
jgi:hypothetical protein